MSATTTSSSAETILTLPSDLEIRISRVFNAPPRLVYEATNKPEHLKHWWGCRMFELVVCEVDLRVGGTFRYVLRAPNGREDGFHGVYREIIPAERVVHTYVYEGVPDHEAITTVTYEEIEKGKTKLTSTILHDSRQSRDGHLQSGMEPGMRETMDRLAELLEALQAA
jgi:uncharacterized protein YndB with AHSA1/START domain